MRLQSFFVHYYQQQVCFDRLAKSQGMSFVEVMVTMAILSLGFVNLLNVYRVSIDRINHLTNRRYAQLVLDNRLTEIEHLLRARQTLPLDVQAREIARIGSRRVDFDQTLDIHALDGFLNLFSVRSSLSWKEDSEFKTLTAQRYIANFRLDS